MPDHCFTACPYLPADCIPWPKSEHEAHIIGMVRLIAWTIALIVILWRSWQLERQALDQEREHHQVAHNECDIEKPHAARTRASGTARARVLNLRGKK